jgi:hypothetical protein
MNRLKGVFSEQIDEVLIDIREGSAIIGVV